MLLCNFFGVQIEALKRDNVNVHRAAAKILQAEKAARPAAPCATYCYPLPVLKLDSVSSQLSVPSSQVMPKRQAAPEQ